MPADKYGKKPYSAGTVKAEKAAIANRDPARKAAAMKLLAQEGTTSAGGGRPAVKMLPKIAPAERRTLPANPNKPAQKQNLPAKANQPVEKRILPYKPAKLAKPVQVISTTKMFKPTPMGKKR